MTRFKICGIRDVENAVAAADAGAHFMGFCFVEGVRRQITPEQGRAVVEGFRDAWGSGGPKLAGLFADQPAAFVSRVVGECGLDFVQLCGSEDASYYRRMPVPVIRQIRVADAGDRSVVIEEAVRRAGRVVEAGQRPMLDTYRPGAQGGTGHTFDWTIAAEVAARFDTVLAGGLTPDNVGEAIAVAGPWCVDVSTGVETAGAKDARKIAAFAAAVRAADAGS